MAKSKGLITSKHHVKLVIYSIDPALVHLFDGIQLI
jgi:hypothetical protein